MISRTPFRLSSLSTSAAPAPKGLLALQMLLATGLLAVAAGWSLPAHAQGMAAMHGGPGMRGEMMAGRGLGHLLDKVNATPDQRTQIKAIMDAARADLKAQHDSGRALHQQMQAALTQPTIDARAVESLRQQIQVQHDAASKRMTQALVDASQVLTPTQRKTVADLMAKRQAMVQRHAAERAALDKPTAP